jgi:hypothetical protein
VHFGLLLEPLQEVLGRRVVEVARQVLTVVERVSRVQHGHRLVHSAQRRRALDVHVDVAGHDRRDPVRVRSELAGGEDLHRHTDVGLLHLVGYDLSTAAVLWLCLRVAVGQPELDVAARTALVVSAAGGEQHERQDGACGEGHSSSILVR